ncbi:MAG TPA: PIN domain-containing protein [Bacteroidales bacterium]|nr:PIN domain-containing protein [Bacteroidales bacterium]
MTDLFIDTDVIIDFITDRQPFSREAAQVFTLIDQRKVRGFTSAFSYSNLYYVLSKYASHKKVITMLKELSELAGILKVDDDIIKSSLASDFKDFEDAIQYYTAQGYKRIDVIITRNIRDYKKSSLPVMTPETFLKTYKQTAS